MSNDQNHWYGTGRLGKDVESRYLPDGKAVASFSIACGSSWNDKNTGDKQESTEWVNVTAFGKLAEICAKYLVKGSQVFISGRMKTDKYTDKQGVEKYATKIIADRMQMLGGKKDGAAPREEAKEPERENVGRAGDMDDDIPF